MAMVNSVTSSQPRPCVSAKFHIRPRTSFGSLALSNICFATVPDNAPFSAPDFSKRVEYSVTFSGASAGTRIGPGPADVGLDGVPLGCAEIGAVGGGRVLPPSNTGNGAAD